MNLVTLLYGIVPESVSHDSACLQGKGRRKGADQNRTGVPFQWSSWPRIVSERDRGSTPVVALSGSVGRGRTLLSRSETVPQPGSRASLPQGAVSDSASPSVEGKKGVGRAKAPYRPTQPSRKRPE